VQNYLTIGFNTKKRASFFIENIEFQGTEKKKGDECQNNVMLVCCGGIYFRIGGWFWKKKAPLRTNERDSKTTE